MRINASKLISLRQKKWLLGFVFLGLFFPFARYEEYKNAKMIGVFNCSIRSYKNDINDTAYNLGEHIYELTVNKTKANLLSLKDRSSQNFNFSRNDQYWRTSTVDPILFIEFDASDLIGGNQTKSGSLVIHFEEVPEIALKLVSSGNCWSVDNSVDGNSSDVDADLFKKKLDDLGLANIYFKQTYASVRDYLLKNNWSPHILADADMCRNDDDRCIDRPEMFKCAPTGAANCIFLWRDNADNKIYRVDTVGESNIRVVSISVFR